MTDPRTTLAATLAGALFGLGLAVSRMVDPEKVLAFLDVAAVAEGDWDPSLLLVLCAAVGVNLVGHRLVLGRPAPLLAPRFELPRRTDLDARLVGGAALFGIGWGLAGYCPGPAIAALGHGSLDALWFTAAMLVGMFAFQTTDAERSATPAS